MKKKKILAHAVIYLLLVLYVIVTLSPLVIVFSSSLRTVGNMSSPLKLFSEFSMESYAKAFRNMNYPSTLWNSIMTTGGSVVVIVFIGAMAAYPISRIKNKLSR